MNTKHLVKTELLPMLEVMPSFQFSKDEMKPIREGYDNLMKTFPPSDIKNVQVRAAFVENPTDGYQVRILIYTPEGADNKKPALLHTHGGGYVIGSPEMNDARNKSLSNELGAVIVSVDYRLAPEFAFPIPQEDSYTALKWLYDNATDLGVDQDRIALYGESAGGGMAATLAIMARDRKEVRVLHQFLIYPMLDDRTVNATNPNPFTGEFIWTHENNRFGWSSLLAEEPGSSNVSPYAAAARVKSVEGLPPTYISVGGLDLFLDEDIAYAHRLYRAGIPTELHIYPGAYHSFDAFMPETAISKQFETDFRNALKRILTT